MCTCAEGYSEGSLRALESPRRRQRRRERILKKLRNPLLPEWERLPLMRELGNGANPAPIVP